MTTQLNTTDDYSPCDKPEFIRVDKERKGVFYVKGSTMSYKLEVDASGNIKCSRRLKSFKEI
jgi:hypothetical protein